MPLIGVTVTVVKSRNLRGRVTLQVDRKKESTQDHRTFDATWEEEFYFPMMAGTTMLLESWDGLCFVGRTSIDVQDFLRGALLRQDWVTLFHDNKEVGELLLSITANSDGHGHPQPGAHSASGTTKTLQVAVQRAEGLSIGDYYVTVSIDDRLIHRTDTKYSTPQPQWEETFRVPLRSGENVQLVVEDARRGVPAAGIGFAADDLLVEIGHSLELPLQSTTDRVPAPRLVLRVEEALADRPSMRDLEPFVRPPVILQPPSQPPVYSPLGSAMAPIPPAGVSPDAAAVGVPDSASRWVILRVEAAEQLPSSAAVFAQLTHGKRSVCTVARPCGGGSVALGTEFAFLLDLMGAVGVELRTFSGLIGMAEVSVSEVLEAVAMGHEMAVEVGEDDGTVRGLVLLTARFGGPDEVHNERRSRTVVVQTRGVLPDISSASIPLTASPVPPAGHLVFSPQVEPVVSRYVMKQPTHPIPTMTYPSLNAHVMGVPQFAIAGGAQWPSGGFLDASPAERQVVHQGASFPYGALATGSSSRFSVPLQPLRYSEALPSERTAKA